MPTLDRSCSHGPTPTGSQRHPSSSGTSTTGDSHAKSEVPPLCLERSTPTPSRPIHKAPPLPTFASIHLDSTLLFPRLVSSLRCCFIICTNLTGGISILHYIFPPFSSSKKKPVTFIIRFPRLNNSPRHLRTIDPLTSTRKINLERHFLDTHISTTPGHLRCRLRLIAIPPPSLLPPATASSFQVA